MSGKSNFWLRIAKREKGFDRAKEGLKIGILLDTAAYDIRELVKYAPLYEEIGFDDLWECDHLLPFYHTDGANASYVVALEAYLSHTKNVPVGSMVAAPLGIRDCPGDVAFHFATMARIHPGRVIMGFGAGEAMNCLSVTGKWPPARERIERLEEAIQVINKVFKSEDYFEHKGKYHYARLYLYHKPEEPVPLVIAANGPKMAALAGKYGDGIVTFFPANLILPPFEKAAKEAGKDPAQLEKIFFASTGYHPEKEKAIKNLQNAASLLVPELYTMVHDVKILEARSQMIRPEIVEKVFVVATSAEDIIKRYEPLPKMGFNHIVWDDWGPYPIGKFPEVAREVISYLKDTYRTL
jgi:coenzyme F420-dependent glucose-6-phosphate dehydrogenase